MIGGVRVTSREVTHKLYLKITTPNHLENTSLPSKPLTPAVTPAPRGNVKKKGNTDGVLIRHGKQHIRRIRSLAFEQQVTTGARLNLSNGGEGKGSRDNIATHNMDVDQRR
jgi:hypothetical protein